MQKEITLSLAILSGIPSLASAAIYQCKVDGQTIFSDQPCGDNAKEIEVKGPARSGTGSMVGAGSQEFLEHRDRKAKVEQIDREISRLRNEKSQAQREMDEALTRYQRQKSLANNNLAGATWEGALAEEAEVMRRRYQSKIDSAERKIDRLREDRRRILADN